MTCEPMGEKRSKMSLRLQQSHAVYLVGDLFGLVSDLADAAANEALNREEGVLRVDNSLALGDLAGGEGLLCMWLIRWFKEGRHPPGRRGDLRPW